VTGARVSVCVLVVDAASPVDACLDALVAPGGRPDGTEVVVVANGAPAPVVERLRRRQDIVLVQSPVNLGFAAGSNLAASVATGDLLVFVNDDSAVEPGCIEALADAASVDPAIGAVCPRVLAPAGTVQEAGTVLWRDGSAAHVGDGLPDRAGVWSVPRDVDVASANGLLVTRAAWEAVGGFDEAYFPAYYEDVDLCLALAASGHRIRYEPRARLVHIGSHSTGEAFRRFLLERNRELLRERWTDALAAFPERPRSGHGRGFVRAVARAASSTHAPIGPRSWTGARAATKRTGSGAPDNPRGRADAASRAAAAGRSLELEYLAFLERRLVEDGDRLARLEAYVSDLPSVRVKRAVARLVMRG
jgi:GT2 family glycosyltransferase